MVCPRCIETVQDILNNLKIKSSLIQLGEVVTDQEVNKELKEDLKKQLSERGFELLEDKKAQLIEKIKSLVLSSIHYSGEPLKISYSSFLGDELHQDYGYLSHLFSSVEGITIEKYIIAQKIEKAKELLVYDELSISEIAYQLNYSSVAHLSNQFKKVTGLTPSHFKKLKESRRISLDKV